MLEKSVSEAEIVEAAKARGMKTLFEDGLQKAIAGITTIEEVQRVTMELKLEEID